jgi:hypothetical protein
VVAKVNLSAIYRPHWMLNVPLVIWFSGKPDFGADYRDFKPKQFVSL